MKLRRLITRLELKEIDDEGTFEGYAAVFGNVDLGGDRVVKGAFRKSLAELKDSGRKLPLFWRHSEPIGVIESAKEDSHGLHVIGRPTKGVQQADEAMALMRDGAISDMSFGFKTLDSRFVKGGVRELTELKIFEASLVPFGMNTEALVTAVKAADFRTLEDLAEALMQGKAFDRELAERIAKAAWPVLPSECDESAAVAKLLESISILTDAVTAAS